MPEVQDIIKKYGKEYKEKHKMLPHVAKAMGAIEKCRTAELGAHIDVCDNCGYEKISYNSCRGKIFSCSIYNTIRNIFNSKTK